jgi:hypothetical protein
VKRHFYGAGGRVNEDEGEEGKNEEKKKSQ